MKGVAVIPVALIFLSLVCEAQLQTSLGDTLIINEVVVRGKPFLRSAGFARNRVDSLALSDYFGWSVSDVLRSSSTLFMKTYGAGGIATISLRGGGASHTVVTWNGINLNSPVLGQSDLSLIPSVAADEITVHNGGSSLPTAQGGLGGVVEIETLPDWNSGPFSTETAVSAGSYGRFSVSSVSRYGGKSWRFASRFNFGKADNDFEYINKWLTGEPSKEKRANATFRNRTYLQEAWNRSKNSVTGARIWLQETNRMIPVPVNVSPSSHREQLESRIVNGILTHDLYFGSDNSFSSSAVIQSEQMIYTDEVTGLVSDYGYKRMILNALLLISNGDRSALRTGVSAGTAMAESDNYTDITIRNNISFSVSGEHRAASFADLNFNSSLNFVDGGFIFPDISAGAEIIPVPRKNLAIRANVAVKSRVPTLNDLHWIPGGNPGLTPERARNA
ncbi:MAG: hypothetical protein FJY11_03880, partial [Bacteroidetes bacterium]|nr:hypothetical protein [Bacteroidota bacterium]